MIRLPKQFNYWAQRHGIYNKSRISFDGLSKRHCAWEPYRRFRITDDGFFQICDGYFDRWANSVGAQTPIPKTQKEFDQAVDFLTDEKFIHNLSLTYEDISNDLIKEKEQYRKENDEYSFYKDEIKIINEYFNNHFFGQSLKKTYRRRARMIKKWDLIPTLHKINKLKFTQKALIRLDHLRCKKT